jgi:hypothetical protein
VRCLECSGYKKLDLYEDPRDPPLADGKVICHDCCEMALEQVIDDAEQHVRDLKGQLAKLKRGL